MLVKSVLIETDGSMKDVIVDDASVHEYMNGDVSFVGAVDALQIVAIARTQPNNEEVNMHTLPPDTIEPGVAGKILLMGSDRNGKGMHICTDEINFYFSPCPLTRRQAQKKK